MARSRKGQTIAIVSTQLEEHIPVKYSIIGRSEWIDRYFEPEALEGIRVLRVSDPSQLHRVKEWLDKHKHHFMDTETTGEDKRAGLDPWRSSSKLLMMQIGNADQVFIVDPDLIPEFKEHLEDPQYTHVFQNGVFDWKYIFSKYNVHINHFYDTMLAEQLLTSGKVIPVNLAAIARRRPPYRIISKSTRRQFVEFQGKFNKEMVYYAARDIVLLPPIMEDQIKQLKEFNMEVVAEDEFNLIPVTGSMELGGVPFSEKTLRLALLYWQKRQDRLEKEILEVYDSRVSAKGDRYGYLLPDMKFEFDVGSHAQKLKALRELGFEIDDTKRDTLDSINDPIAELLGLYSEALKVNSTYGENLIQRVNPDTHRLQVEFNQLGHGDIESKAGKATTIATGRYSSDFQQLPRGRVIYEPVIDEELEQIQAMFQSKIDTLLKEAE
jgi:DNA polymerase I-like protein with 3'-5' exonuclease and polymerase domains